MDAEGGMDKTFFRVGKLSEQGNDFDFWQTQSYEKRLATLEAIRREYNNWKYGPDQPFQRVYRVINQKNLPDNKC
jgi:hypothetical protein